MLKRREECDTCLSVDINVVEKTKRKGKMIKNYVKKKERERHLPGC